MKSFVVVSLCALVFALSIGCSKGTVRTEPVEGIVTLDGVPVEQAALSFSLLDSASNISAFGETDASGLYRLTMHPRGAIGKGTIEGKYAVSIIKQDAIPVPGKFIKSSDPEIPDAPVVDIVDVIPRKYYNTSTSGLTATVVRGKNRIDFSLKSE